MSQAERDQIDANIKTLETAGPDGIGGPDQIKALLNLFSQMFKDINRIADGASTP
jgi:hypothetical protein